MLVLSREILSSQETKMSEHDSLIAAATKARENATYGLTLCAERVAIFKAISEGERRFDSIAVVTDTDALTPPCGACRQIIWEFCGDIPVVLANLKGKVEVLRMSQLFPKPFDSSNL